MTHSVSKLLQQKDKEKRRAREEAKPEWRKGNVRLSETSVRRRDDKTWNLNSS